MKSADELFKSITGFDEVDVNLLEGVHTTYNALSSRFEIAPDDNRNVSYPFEYCWQKTSEVKQPKEDIVDSDEDEFEEMWTHSIQNKPVDAAANFGNEVQMPVSESSSETIIDKKVSFGNVIDVAIPKKVGDISSGFIDKKS